MHKLVINDDTPVEKRNFSRQWDTEDPSTMDLLEDYAYGVQET